MPAREKKKAPRERRFTASGGMVQVWYVPGRSITLRALRGNIPCINLERQADGRIEARRTENHRGQQPGRPGNAITLYRPGAGTAEASRKHGLLAAALALPAQIRRWWKDESCFPEDEAEAARRCPEDEAEAARSLIEQLGHHPLEEDRHLAQEAATLTDQATWNSAWSIVCGELARRWQAVTLDQYNWAAALGPLLDNLRATNPGAVSWLFAYCENEGPVEHPGQVTTAVKGHMRRSGLLDSSWRTAATMPEPVMKAITAWVRPEPAAALLNLIALAGRAPNKNTATVLAHQAAMGRLRLDGAGTQAGTLNAETVAVLACRESARHTPESRLDHAVTSQIGDAMDYATAQAADGRQIRSTTWNGLMKASEWWHRRMRHAQAVDEWEEILRRTNGHYRAWNSLIGETEAGGFQVVPLTDERELHQESLDMEHCVVTYRMKCAAGRSRIFSLRSDGTKIATGEIVLGPAGWQETQTRGRRNTDPGRDAARAMRRTADLYNSAWKGTGQKDTGQKDTGHERPHQTWYVDAETGRKVTDPGTAGNQARSGE